MATTKFEITMTLEVENRSVMSKMRNLLFDTVKEAVEGLGDGQMIKVDKMAVSQKTFPKGLVKTSKLLDEINV